MSLPEFPFAAIIFLVGAFLGVIAGRRFARGGIAPTQVHPEPGAVTKVSNVTWLELRSRPAYYVMPTDADANAAATFAAQSSSSDNYVLWEGHRYLAGGSNRIFFDCTDDKASPAQIGRQFNPVLVSTTGELPTVRWNYQGGGGPQSLTLSTGPAARLRQCLDAIKGVASNDITSIQVTNQRVYLELTLPEGYRTTKT